MKFAEAPDVAASRAAPTGDVYVCEECAHSCPAITMHGIWEELNKPLPEPVLRRVNLYVLLFILGLLVYGLLLLTKLAL